MRPMKANLPIFQSKKSSIKRNNEISSIIYALETFRKCALFMSCFDKSSSGSMLHKPKISE
ncbi:hypothetical protein HZS_3022 [Henneguya salminicola]|nr:hypothetical protein HZS_3022 [Henneguya salminicola]